MNDIFVSIAKDFTITPGGRYIKEGPYSGELFREQILFPKYIEAKAKGVMLVVNLDGCMGYPSSFLDESFGGLVALVPDEDILKRIKLISDDEPGLIEKVKKNISDWTEKK